MIGYISPGTRLAPERVLKIQFEPKFRMIDGNAVRPTLNMQPAEERRKKELWFDSRDYVWRRDNIMKGRFFRGRFPVNRSAQQGTISDVC